MSPLSVAGRAVVAVIAVVLLPGLVLTAIGLSSFASISALIAIAVAIPTMRVSPRMGLLASGVLAVASTLAVPAGASPLWAGVLMVVMALLTGLAAHVGASSALIMAPISITFLLAEPVTTTDGAPVDAWLVGAVVLASAMWAVGVASLLARGHERAQLQAPSLSRSVIYAGTLAVAVGIAMTIVVDRGLGHGGAWFVMTLLIVIQPYVQDALRKTVERGLGTVLGFGIAMVVIALLPNEVPRYLAGGVFAVLATIALLVQHRPYWQYVTVLTPAIVLLEGAAVDTTATAWQRLTFTLLGVALAVMIELMLYPLVRRGANRAGVDHY